MGKYREELSDKEKLSKQKRHKKKLKSKSFSSEIKDAVNKKHLNNKQSY